MENNEMKKPIPVELDEELLDAVSGGTGGLPFADDMDIPYAESACGGICGEARKLGDTGIRNI